MHFVRKKNIAEASYGELCRGRSKKDDIVPLYTFCCSKLLY